MTIYHFGNCLALAYGPFFLTYKYSSLPEYGAFWKCFQVGGVYVLTQLLKMLLLATFFPTTDGLSETSNLFHEFIKTTIDFGDLIGLSVVMGKTVGGRYSVDSGYLKIMIVGLGWAFADLILTKALPLWVGARGLQFDWKYILMSLDANISLIQHLSMSCLVWLWWRHNLSSSFRPLVAILLVISVYRPILPLILQTVLKTRPIGFTLFAFTSIPTLCIAFLALHIFIIQTANCSKA